MEPDTVKGGGVVAGALPESVWVGGRSGAWGVGAMRRAVVQDARDLVRGWGVVRQVVRSTLKVRYQNSVLGVLWTLVNPLLMLGVLSLVFSQVVRFEMDRFTVFLFAGMAPWGFFSAGVTTCAMSLVTQQSLMRRINARAFLFPLSDLAVAAVHNLVALVALLVLCMFLGLRVTEHTLLLPVALLVLYVFTAGVALLAMCLTTFYRDFEHLIGVGLQALYFATPIFYDRSMVPKIAWLLDANPMTWILAWFRAALYHNRWPTGPELIGGPAVAVAALVLGYVAYRRCEREFIFRL